jgi:HEPN domain-containing protein
MPGRSERLPKEKAWIYLQKAEDFGVAMRASLEECAWHGATVTAVHCVISACDAVCVHALGERSRGESHDQLTLLLKRVGVAVEQIRQVAAVLQMKNVAEYDARVILPDAARDAVKRAERVLGWARATLGMG